MTIINTCYFIQVMMAKAIQIKELKQTSAKKIEEETERIMKHAQEMIEKAETDKQDILITCRTESKEQIKKTIVECDAKVSSSHVRRMLNITN